MTVYYVVTETTNDMGKSSRSPYESIPTGCTESGSGQNPKILGQDKYADYSDQRGEASVGAAVAEGVTVRALAVSVAATNVHTRLFVPGKPKTVASLCAR
jgi:hypothetical protein